MIKAKLEIPPGIYAAHRELSACSLRFPEYVTDNPEGLKRSNFNVRVKDERFSYFRSRPWPTFINQQAKAGITEAVRSVYNLVTEIPGRLFHYDYGAMSRYYRVPGEGGVNVGRSR